MRVCPCVWVGQLFLFRVHFASLAQGASALKCRSHAGWQGVLLAPHPERCRVRVRVGCFVAAVATSATKQCKHIFDESFPWSHASHLRRSMPPKGGLVV